MWSECLLRHATLTKGSVEEGSAVCLPGRFLRKCSACGRLILCKLQGDKPKNFCDAVPDCEKDNQCPSNARCVETQVKDRKGRALFKCQCSIGYRKAGSQCAPIPECTENPGLCGPTATCVEQDVLYKCVCPPGTVDVGTGALQSQHTCPNMHLQARTM